MMIDWMKIKTEVRYFVVALVSCALMLAISLYYHQQRDASWQAAKRNLTQQKIKYQQARDRVSLLQAYENHFNKLKSQGVYGEEQRIQWIETIQSSADKHRIPSVKFNIDQQSKLDKDGLVDLSGIDVYQSKMNLDFHLLHEGDLFALLSDLDRHAHGLNTVNKCVVKNNFSELNSVVDSPSLANFSGFCELYWYTLDEEREDDGEGDSDA